MRANIKEFATIVSKTLPITEPIYEFGSFQVPGQLGFADLRPLFPGKEYIGCDMREGPGVDKILNLHALDQPSGSVGTVLCLDTLEHVEYPNTAMEEIYRILKPDGMAVITSVMCFPIHDYPNDYWRFSPEAFRSMLKPFAQAFVGFQGQESFPHTVVGVGFKGSSPPLSQFTDLYGKWQNREKGATEQIVRRLTPPILLPPIFWLLRAARGLTRRSA